MAINNYKHNLNEPLQLNDVIASKLDVIGITSTGTLNAGTLNATSLNVSGVTSTGPLNINGITTIRGSASSGNLQPLQINQTWTAGSGTATALTVNVTDTSSNASSNLLDLRVGASPKFMVDKSGGIHFQSRYGTTGSSDQSGAWFKTSNSGGIRANWGNGGGGWIFGGIDTNNSIILDGGSGGRIGFNKTRVIDDLNHYTDADVWLYRDSAGILAQRNGTNPQTFRIYNNVTGTGNTNFERAYLGWTSNTFVVGTQTGGISTARQMEFQTNGTTRVAITTTGLVGIGTTIPLQNLHVLGNLLVAAGSSTGQHITQRAYEVNNGTLSWEGSAGQLFSITNNLTTGSIFAVNDVSGIPSIDVDANGIIQIGPYGGNVGIGTTNPTSKLHVVGNTLVSGVTTTGLLNVGVGGTIITTTGIGSVGIGSTQPGSTLVVNAPSGYTGNILDVKRTGDVSDALNLSRTSVSFRGSASGGNVVFVDYNQYLFYVGFDLQFHMSNHKFSLEDEGTYAWSSNTNANGTADLTLYRDSANVLALRGGINGGNTGVGQTFRIYNTYTSASQYERAYLGWNNNVFQIGVDTAGISTARSINLVGAAGSNTGDTLQPLQINQTWTSGTGIATALTVNVTDTSSNASSRLLDLRVGGSSRFRVDKNGWILATDSLYGLTVLASIFDTPTLLASTTHLFLNSSLSLSNNNPANGADIFLTRDAANTLAQRNGTNPQTFRIYNTYTSASQYERAYLGWNNNVFQIGVDTAGISTARQMEFQTNGTTRVAITTTGLVGIGTTNPSAKLDINAGIAITATNSSTLNITQTWNNASQTFTAINANITDTASSSGFLMKLDRNNYPGFRVVTSKHQEGGAAIRVHFRQASIYDNYVELGPNGGNYTLGLIANTANNGATTLLQFQSGRIALPETQFLGFGPDASFNGYGGFPLIGYDSSSGALAQRNGVTPQTYRIYNTYTSATNFERGSLGWSNNVFRIGTEKGTAGGTARQLELQTDGTTRVAITTDGFIDGTAFQSYELDDISTATDGQENTFVPRFNYDRVTITNPFRLTITVNGIPQSAFINNTDYVYQSNFLGSNNGYTIDTDNNIKFTESIPTGSEIVARVLPVSNTATRIKFYPFKPADILLGY